MPATFVHLLLVDKLLGDLDRLDKATALTRDVKSALGRHRPFCLLGAVSPDLPYLDRRHPDAEGWANVMHYGGTMDMVRRGLAALRNIDRASDAENVRWQKGVAWLFGYLSHIQADVTEHPIVSAIIKASYVENPDEHRRCELGQDAWLFAKLKNQSLTRVEWLKHSGLLECRSENDGDSMDPAILELWQKMLGGLGDPVTVFDGTPEDRHPEHAPDPSAWYNAYVGWMDKFVTEGGNFPLIIRRLFEKCAIVYPEPESVEARYVSDIRVETRTFGTYQDVFNFAAEEILGAWSEAAQALVLDGATAFARANVNLDTGAIIASRVA